MSNKRNVRESDAWRDIVDSTIGERDDYNRESLRDYMDIAVDYFDEMVASIDLSDEDEREEVVQKVADLMATLQDKCGQIDNVYICGNGYYFPAEGDEVRFLNGRLGVQGDFSWFSMHDLPTYQDLIDNKKDPKTGKYALKPTLCLELDDGCEYIKEEDGLGVVSNGERFIVPISGQDLCYTRSGIL